MTSSADQNPSIGNFAELSEDECKKLLTQHTAGRIGFMAPDGPQILPVTYQFRNGSVILYLTGRTFVRTYPADQRCLRDRAIDEQQHSGWSVLVLGFAEAMAHNYLLSAAWGDRPRALGRWNPESVH